MLRVVVALAVLLGPSIWSTPAAHARLDDGNPELTAPSVVVSVAEVCPTVDLDQVTRLSTTTSSRALATVVPPRVVPRAPTPVHVLAARPPWQRIARLRSDHASDP